MTSIKQGEQTFEWGQKKAGFLSEMQMDHCLHSNQFFREKKKHLSDDKLLKNDINVAGEDDTPVILAPNGL